MGYSRSDVTGLIRRFWLLWSKWMHPIHTLSECIGNIYCPHPHPYLFLRLHTNSEYPFELKTVSRTGGQCERCPWYKFCSGCLLQCNDDHFSNACSYLAIDWEPTTLHLRYQYNLERVRGGEWDESGRKGLGGAVGVVG